MSLISNNRLTISTSVIGNEHISLMLNIDDYVACYHVCINGKLEYAHKTYKLAARKYEICIGDALGRN